MSCRCERKEILEQNGDWDCLKNEETIHKANDLKLLAGIYNAVTAKGLYIEFGSEETNDSITWWPKHCPWCGRKLREDESFVYCEY